MTHVAGAYGYARVRRGPVALAVFVICVAVLAAARGRTLHVPFAPELVLVQAFYVAPVVPVVVLGLTLPAPLAALEEVTAERLRLLRSAHVLSLGLLLVVSCLAVSGGRPVELAAFGRNAALLLGLLLLAGALLDAELGWVAAVLPAAVCFFAGTSYDDNAVRPWAVLIRPPSTATALLAVAVLAVGAAVYVRRGAARRTG